MQGPQVVPIPRFYPVPKFPIPPPNFQKSPLSFPATRQQHAQPQQNIEFDGKRLRKAVTRKTVDYNSSVIKYLESRVWQRDYRDRRVIQPDSAYYTEMTPPLSMPDNPINAVTTKFVRTSTNKMRCPIFCVAWTPEGRRLVTGASSGEFTLWNGLTFNFETILQAHDSPVRCMVWSHNDLWMVTGDHAGYVKYWQSNMNNVKMFQAHKEPLRGISFCPVDTKFVTCSDDGTVRIWDFLKCFEEKILRGHGADVKCVDWHPTKSLIVSGSKDSQQPIKLWDPKSAQSLATIHAHKNTVMDAKWNKNGNWLITASRDHLIKLFDIRNMNQEMQTFRGHKKEATTVAWHPTHEGLFTSGGSDGCVMFWVVGADKEVGCMEQAHDSCVWSLAWHPLGHILCSGSNDHSSKFWTRNRPGDRMRDKYNLNTLPKGQEDAADYDDSSTISAIPGMGLEYGLPDHLKAQETRFETEVLSIPGLDLTSEESIPDKTTQKKIPFSKPIPKQFQQQWMESKQPLLLAPPLEHNTNGEIPQHMINENMMPPPLPPPPPPMSLLPPNEQQHHFPPPNSMNNNQFPEQQQRPPQLISQNPMDFNQQPPPIKQEMHFVNMPPGDMPPYHENQENYPMEHPPIKEERPRETWRTYDQPSDSDIRPKHNEMHPENGGFPPHNTENRQDFEHQNNIMGPPPNRGQPERFHPDHHMEGNFMPENMHPGSGQPPFGDDMFPNEGTDSRDNHMGPRNEEMGFVPHKRSWNDGPGQEEPYRPGPGREEPHHDNRNPQNFPQRHEGRGQMHHGPPRGGSRGSYRGSRGGSPYRMVSRGRGSRGGYRN